MPVHIEEMTSEVSIIEGELPLTAQQIDKLVRLIMRRIDERCREAEKVRQATEVRRQASRPFEAGK